MKKLSLFLRTLLVALIATFVLGCGGGGGAKFVGGLNVFVTDDMSTGYDHIWVVLKKIEVQDDTGAFFTVYQNTSGEVIDLVSLNDGSPLFRYMSTHALPIGSYTGARVTMDTDLSVVVSGDTTATACVFDATFDAGSGNSAVSYSFSTPMSYLGADGVAIDFDLPNWERVGTTVTPAIVEGDDTNASDPNRNEEEDYQGTVSGLDGTAPSQSFTMTGAEGTFHVTTDANTFIYRENASGSPALANNLRVEVTGVFVVADGAILARSVKIEDSNSSDTDDKQVSGATENVDDVAQTFDVSADEIEGFVPSALVVHVQTSTSTRFMTEGGLPMTQGEFYVLIGGGSQQVEVEGTYDSGSNTMTAAKVRLHPEDGDENEVEAYGTVASFNSGTKTIVLTVQSWMGFASSNGASLSVVTDGSTEFEDENGDGLNETDFYAALVNGAAVEVEGVFDGTSLLASEVHIEALDGTPEPEAKGYVTAFDETGDTITVTLIEWRGFTSSFGTSVTIDTSSASEFEDINGATLTKAQFYAGLEVGTVVKAEGTYSAGTVTASKAELDD